MGTVNGHKITDGELNSLRTLQDEVDITVTIDPEEEQRQQRLVDMKAREEAEREKFLMFLREAEKQMKQHHLLRFVALCFAYITIRCGWPRIEAALGTAGVAKVSIAILCGGFCLLYIGLSVSCA